MSKQLTDCEWVSRQKMNARQEMNFRAERRTEERVANRGKRRERKRRNSILRTDINTSMSCCTASADLGFVCLESLALMGVKLQSRQQ